MSVPCTSGARSVAFLQVALVVAVGAWLLVNAPAALARSKNLPLIEAEEEQCVRHWLPRHQQATRAPRAHSAEWTARWCLQWRARAEHARGMAVVDGSGTVDVRALACANQARLDELVGLGLRLARSHGALATPSAHPAR